MQKKTRGKLIERCGFRKENETKIDGCPKSIRIKA